MSKKGLLIESIDTSLTESVIVTNDDQEKEYYIEGIFLQSEVINGNRRIYPKQIMDTQVRKYITEKVEKNRAMGELEHPEEDRDNSINLRYVSHKIIELREDGNNWWGKAMITKKTPMGATVVGLMDSGITLGTSSRADGTAKKMANGISVVQSDFRLITPSDIVADPSAPDALVTNIMERKEWIYENDILREVDVEIIHEKVNKICRVNTLDEAKLNEMFGFILQKIGRNG